MDYYRQNAAGRVFICFDEDELEYGREYVSGEEPITEEEVTVDPNNCVKVWTFDNEYVEDDFSFNPADGKPYVFATKQDAYDWLEVSNGDGHANNPYHWVIVEDGIETVVELGN